DAVGDVSSMTFDAAGQELTATDPLGHLSQPVFDLFKRGLASSQQSAVGSGVAEDTLSAFDNAGQATATRDAAGNWATLGLDMLGRATLTTDPQGGKALTQFDLGGQALATRDAVGRWTKTAYDLMGRQTQVTDNLGHSSSTGYDQAGNV